MTYVIAAAVAAVLLTVQPGRDILTRYVRFSVAFFAAAPVYAWLIIAWALSVGAIVTLPLAVACSAVGLAHRWTTRPILRNARVEMATATARRKVRRRARRDETAGAVLIAGSAGQLRPAPPSPAQIAHLPHSDTGSYMLVNRNGVPTLEPVQ